jgi:hypothetical protein
MIGLLMCVLHSFFGRWNGYVNICNTPQAYRSIVRQMLPLNGGRTLVLQKFTGDVIRRYPHLTAEITDIYNEVLNV